MTRFTKTLLILGWTAGATQAIAAVPGALESFPKLENAQSWSVYDYADETTYYPQWRDDAEPYIYLLHYADAPLWFFTDQTGSPDWLGDYQAEDIQSIKVDVFIDTLEDFDEMDCTVFTNGPAGWQDYYSAPLLYSDFPASGWWELTFDLNATWFYFDDGWISVEMTPEHFQEVEEIGFRFFPRIGTTAERLAAIDEVRLEPLVKAPVLEYSSTADNFQLKFTPLNANTCFIEKLSDDPTPVWEEVAGQTRINGPDEYLFSTPLSDGRGIFRVGAEAEYTQVTTPIQELHPRLPLRLTSQ